MSSAGLYLEIRSETDICYALKDLKYAEGLYRADSYLPLFPKPGLSIAETLSQMWELDARFLDRPKKRVSREMLCQTTWHPFSWGWSGVGIEWGILVDWRTQHLLVWGLSTQYKEPPSVRWNYLQDWLARTGWQGWQMRYVRDMLDFARYLGISLPETAYNTLLPEPWPLDHTRPYVYLNQDISGWRYVLVSLHSQARWHHRLYYVDDWEWGPENMLGRLLLNGQDLARWPTQASAELPHQAYVWASVVIDADSHTLAWFSEFPEEDNEEQSALIDMQQAIGTLWSGWQQTKMPDYRAHLTHFLDPVASQELLMHPLAWQRWVWGDETHGRALKRGLACSRPETLAEAPFYILTHRKAFQSWFWTKNAESAEALPLTAPCFHPNPAMLVHCYWYSSELDITPKSRDYLQTIPAPWLFVFDLLYGCPDWLPAELLPWRERDFEDNWRHFAQMANLPHLVFQALHMVAEKTLTGEIPRRALSEVFDTAAVQFWTQHLLTKALPLIEARDLPLLTSLAAEPELKTWLEAQGWQAPLEPAAPSPAEPRTTYWQSESVNHLLKALQRLETQDEAREWDRLFEALAHPAPVWAYLFCLPWSRRFAERILTGWLGPTLPEQVQRLAGCSPELQGAALQLMKRAWRSPALWMLLVQTQARIDHLHTWLKINCYDYLRGFEAGPFCANLGASLWEPERIIRRLLQAEDFALATQVLIWFYAAGRAPDVQADYVAFFQAEPTQDLNAVAYQARYFAEGAALQPLLQLWAQCYQALPLLQQIKLLPRLGVILGSKWPENPLRALFYQALRHRDPELACTAAIYLGQQGEKQALPVLRRAGTRLWNEEGLQALKALKESAWARTVITDMQASGQLWTWSPTGQQELLSDVVRLGRD